MHPNQSRFNRIALRFSVSLIAVLGAAACEDPVPRGQVIARVGGEDLTASEFEFETGRTPSLPPSAMDNATLVAMVRRKALAKIARDQGLEQDPTYHFELRRAREALLAEALYRRLADTRGAASENEIAQYIKMHPWQFAQRRVLELASVDGTSSSMLVIDSATFRKQPPGRIMEISQGETLLWQGVPRTVLRVRNAPLGADAARVWAANQLSGIAVEEGAAKLYRKFLEGGQLQYARGYGPSGDQGQQGN